jgi:hypothetical protein
LDVRLSVSPDRKRISYLGREGFKLSVNERSYRMENRNKRKGKKNFFLFE